MRRSLTIKNYFRAALIMGVFAALAIYLPNQEAIDGQHEIYFGIPASEASVAQQVFGNADFGLRQLNGVRIVNRDTGKYTYYFEYIANKQDTLRRIAALPFLKDNRPSSLACELMYSPLNPLDNSALSQEERDATSFFWDVRADEFTFYECYKSPVKHTLLISKTSDRILHKVELI
jgi:hypothetical protein